MQHNASTRRKLWTMTCENLFQILAASLSPEEIGRLCHKHGVALPEAPHSQVALYQLAHKQCHRDSPFSRQVQRYLNRKHTAVVRHFAATSPELVRQEVETRLTADSPGIPADMAGVIWAVSSDPRQTIRPVAQWLVDELHLLSHCLLLAQFRGNVQVVGPGNSTSDTRSTALLQEVAQLSAERQQLQAALRRLEQQATRLAQENAGLKSRLADCTSNCTALQRQLAVTHPPAPSHGETLRDFKKLRYQVAKLTTSVADKEAEILRLRALLASDATRLRRSPVEAQALELSHLPPPTPSPPSLQGKTVVLIGGLDRAASHYERLMREFGCCGVLHNGNQGHKKLAELIRQADIVLCPVDCNSHGATTAAKKLCRTMHKPCYFLRSSGVSHIREKLLELANRD
jgi:hypothetical protein